jgi:cytochrome d ubiquinol oxidase subunit II
MFETLSHLTLQQYWWTIISLLGSILVFLMFVQGGQTLIGQVAKTEVQKDMAINSIGRKWDLTFTTLVTFGGAFFASFPIFYATSFGGAYWLWMLILFTFIVQAISYEFRKKPANFLGQKTYETFLFVNGLFGTLLIGIAVSTLFTGSAFSVDQLRLTAPTSQVISRWENSLHGLEAIADGQNLLLGLSVFLLARIEGALYFIATIDDHALYERARKQVIHHSLPFLVAFVGYMVLLLTGEGYAVNPGTGEIFMESHKYLHNYLEMPVVLIFLVTGVLGVLGGIGITWLSRSRKGIWFTGGGTFLTVFSLFLVAGFNGTAYYPSTYDMQSSLTIQNSSSSHYTLTAMGYGSLLMPFVIGYIWYAWRLMNRKNINAQEMESGEHAY